MCPAADGSAALHPPTRMWIPISRRLIALRRSRLPRSTPGIGPQIGPLEIGAFLAESRAFVTAMDAAIEDRLRTGATLRDLCEYVDTRLGPLGADPVNLMFAVHGICAVSSGEVASLYSIRLRGRCARA